MIENENEKTFFKKYTFQIVASIIILLLVIVNICLLINAPRKIYYKSKSGQDYVTIVDSHYQTQYYFDSYEICGDLVTFYLGNGIKIVTYLHDVIITIK